MAIYRDYARVYDESGQLAFSLKMIPIWAGSSTATRPWAGMLDLACGTGTVAISLAEAGWRVYGIDGSAEMLAQARAKAEGEGSMPTGASKTCATSIFPSGRSSPVSTTA